MLRKGGGQVAAGGRVAPIPASVIRINHQLSSIEPDRASYCWQTRGRGWWPHLADWGQQYPAVHQGKPFSLCALEQLL